MLKLDVGPVRRDLTPHSLYARTETTAEVIRLQVRSMQRVGRLGQVRLIKSDGGSSHLQRQLILERQVVLGMICRPRGPGRGRKTSGPT